MTTAQVVETSVTVNNNSPILDYVHPDDQTQPFVIIISVTATAVYASFGFYRLICISVNFSLMALGNVVIFVIFATFVGFVNEKR